MGTNGFSVTTDWPATVTEGDDYEVVFDITNQETEGKVLESITYSSGIYEGIFVNTSDPVEVDWDIADGEYESLYDLDVPAEGSARVLVDMSAVISGEYHGTVSLCFDEAKTDCIYEAVSMTIE